MDNLKLIFRLYVSPASAMSDIIDGGSWLFSAAAMLLVLFAFQVTVNSRVAATYQVTKFNEYLQNSNFSPDDENTGHLTDAQLDEARYLSQVDLDHQLNLRPFPLVGSNILYLVSFEPFFVSPLVSLCLLFVPALLLLARGFGAAGYAGTNARNNYMPLATCTLMAWTAAHLPFTIAGVALSGLNVDGAVFLGMWLAGGAAFGMLTVFAVRTVLGVNYGPAVMIVLVAALAFPLGMHVFRHVSPFLFSPFLIIMVVLYFGGFLSGEARGFGNAFRQRQNFKRFLHNATVNPKDADAHVQLGLIYLQRRQEVKAVEHLGKAIEIDPDEIDANYELGKIARTGGDLQTALDHFGVVLEQNEKHALSEIWREIGATYLAANMLTEARDALSKFVDRRSADVEGLYYLGRVLKAQGETERAAETFREAVASAEASPDFSRANTRQWGKLAQKELQ